MTVARSALAAAGVLALLGTLPLWGAPMSQFDGGIAASSATFTLHGQFPYRDYWLLYGPLSGAVVAVPTAMFGPSIELLKVFGTALVVLQAVLLCALALRWTYPLAAVLLGAVPPLILPASLGIEPSAWSVAMTLALASLLARFHGASPLLVGVLAGAAAAGRLDVGAYLLIALMTMERRILTLTGFLLVVLPLSALVIVNVPVPALVEQLIWYPIVGPRQYRGIPGLDSVLASNAALIATITLVWVPRATIIVALVRGLKGRRSDVVALSVFAGLCQLQTLGRADFDHFAMAAVPSVPLLATFVARGRMVSSVGLATVVALSVAMVVFGRSIREPLGPDVDRELMAAIEVAESITTREDPIFVGLTSNRHTTLNPLIAYYLAESPPATATTMYNPGITNTQARQSQMVRELEAAQTKVAILNNQWSEFVEPWNDSRVPGSTVLDEYLDRTFRVLCAYGSVEVRVRRSADAMAVSCPEVGAAN